jgi:hypothetical protein
MPFLENTQNILRLVEERTGKPVEVLSDPSMTVLAKVKMAKGLVPSHILMYHPGKQCADYHIAYECGFILRLYENAPEDRYEFATTGSGRQSVHQALASNKKIRKMNLPDQALKQFTDQIYSGLMTQLRSVPIGLRIDEWLWNEYSGLREFQLKSMRKQQQDNVQVLASETRTMVPAKIFSANATMNAAYATFCDRLLEQDLYAVAYRSVGFENAGERLLNLYEKVPSDATHDRELVDAWGKELELENWYKWAPVE